MLPTNLNYRGKIESAPSTSYTTCIQPQSGSGNYTVGNTIIFNIPTANNTVLSTTESYLKFKLAITNGSTANAWRWDSTAHGIIDRIRIFSGSNILQDISSYNLLAKMLFALQIPDDASQNKFNVLAGSRTGYSQWLTGNGTALTASEVNNTYYCLNLISLVGSLCANSYLPLFAMTSAPLRVEITLVSNAVNAYCDVIGNTTFQVSDCEYVANFIKLSDSAMDMIYSSLGGQPLQVCVPDYSNYSSNINLTNNANTQISFPIPAKFSSLRAIIVGVRTTTGVLAQFPLSCTAQGLCTSSSNSYFFRVGSQILPSKAVDNQPMAFAEVLKSLGSMSDILYTPNISTGSYTLNTDTAMTTGTVSTSHSGSAFFGIDLENFPNANKSSIFAGYNSNVDDIYFVGTFKTPNSTGSFRIDGFALYDSVLVFENNTCYRKF